jgi:hypothetical protein
MSRPEQGATGRDEGNTFAESVAQQHPGGDPRARKEVGTAASSRLHPPHVDENADDAPVQAGHGNPAEIPALPANASGRDKVTTAEHGQPIDEESMYDRRTSQDKDRPPSANAGH